MFVVIEFDGRLLCTRSWTLGLYKRRIINVLPIGYNSPVVCF